MNLPQGGEKNTSNNMFIFGTLQIPTGFPTAIIQWTGLVKSQVKLLMMSKKDVTSYFQSKNFGKMKQGPY